MTNKMIVTKDGDCNVGRKKEECMTNCEKINVWGSAELMQLVHQ